MKLLTSKLVLVPAAVLAFSCGNHRPADTPAVQATSGSTAQATGRSADSTGVAIDTSAPGLGTYTGHYSKGMLVLVINYLSDKFASGYDIHKGLRRNLNGSVDEKDGKLMLELKEPGHNPADGTFYLTLAGKDKITGKWEPANPTADLLGGPVELTRTAGPWETSKYNGSLFGDLGQLTLHTNGTCDLQYYPSKDTSDRSQLVTIRGNCQLIGDTLRIEWQYNTHLPVMKMTLIAKPFVEGNDSIPAKPASFEGNGVKFEESMAG